MYFINPYIFKSGGNPLWNGLQAYYTADNTPNDALGTYNGTLVNGATYGTGIINQGFSFDGVNDYVNFGNVLDFDGSTPFSISCWVSGNSLNLQSILSKYISTNKVGYELFFISNKVRLALVSTITTDNLIVEMDTVLSTSIMYNIIVTYDGSKTPTGINFYLNGTLDTKTTIANNLTGSISNSNSLCVGSRGGTSFFHNGIIDELGIWNRVLSASEVTELYNAGAAKQYPN